MGNRLNRKCAWVVPGQAAEKTGVFLLPNARLLLRALSSRVRSKPELGTHVDYASRFVADAC
jgi:hypothetical protein